MEQPAEQWNAAAAGIEPVELCFPYAYLSLGQQVVTLTGMTLTVVRSPRGEPFEQTFDLLRIHDLRVIEAIQNTRFGWPYYPGENPNWLYGVPEPICFTYRGGRHSIGVASRVFEACHAVQMIAAYDQHVRARLGMDPQPSITTIDDARIAESHDELWDEHVPLRCMY